MSSRPPLTVGIRIRSVQDGRQRLRVRGDRRRPQPLQPRVDDLAAPFHRTVGERQQRRRPGDAHLGDARRDGRRHTDRGRDRAVQRTPRGRPPISSGPKCPAETTRTRPAAGSSSPSSTVANWWSTPTSSRPRSLVRTRRDVVALGHVGAHGEAERGHRRRRGQPLTGDVADDEHAAPRRSGDRRRTSRRRPPARRRRRRSAPRPRTPSTLGTSGSSACCRVPAMPRCCR